MREGFWGTALALSAVLFAMGCSGMGARANPTGAALGSPSLGQRLDAALAVQQAEADANEDGAALRLRHNPCACDCPPHEVQVGGIWQRVQLDGDAETLEALALQWAQQPMAEVATAVSVEAQWTICGRGAPLLRAKVAPMLAF